MRTDGVTWTRVIALASVLNVPAGIGFNTIAVQAGFGIVAGDLGTVLNSSLSASLRAALLRR